MIRKEQDEEKGNVSRYDNNKQKRTNNKKDKGDRKEKRKLTTVPCAYGGESSVAIDILYQLLFGLVDIRPCLQAPVPLGYRRSQQRVVSCHRIQHHRFATRGKES